MQQFPPEPNPGEDPFTAAFAAKNFQGIPQRQLPDDCMECALFYHDKSIAEPSKIKPLLEDIKRESDKLIQKWTEGYIWQRESFSLELAEVELEKEKCWCLKGRIEYGDSVEDEWFAVWMLREISRRWGQLWIRVYDTEGEFLLIEAANTLPRWINPENADYRVWINSGKLIIIPLTASLPSAQRTITSLDLPTALSLLALNKTQHIRLVEEEAFFRTTKYPKRAQEHLHHAVLQIPRKIAKILHSHPEAIAPAVETFYLRDPISLQSLNKMKNFPPEDAVTVSVKFTKVLYAQLKGQVFDPPKGSGFKRVPPGNKNFSQADIGMKVTCGFEMMLADENAPQLSSPSRKRILECVKETLETAREPGDEEIGEWPLNQDPEDWLDIDYEEFEEKLSGKGKGKEKAEEDGGFGDKDAEENLKRMVQRFEAFLNDEDAGPEGAEFEDEMDVDDDEEIDSEGEDKEVSFDEKRFGQMMREMMGMPPEDDDGDDDEMEEGEGEEKEIRRVMDLVEAELREAGALDDGREKNRIREVDENYENDDDDGDDEREIDIDFNLARNMLESFKGQGGMAGPGGNLLARMGISLPRDEGNEHQVKTV
ncbi:hypothetical protein RUND412_000513 [Rhizina undulata]